MVRREIPAVAVNDSALTVRIAPNTGPMHGVRAVRAETRTRTAKTEVYAPCEGWYLRALDVVGYAVSIDRRSKRPTSKRSWTNFRPVTAEIEVASPCLGIWRLRRSNPAGRSQFSGRACDDRHGPDIRIRLGAFPS